MDSKMLERIEELRQSLIRLVEQKGTTDREVLQASRGLDEALNQYYRRLLDQK